MRKLLKRWYVWLGLVLLLGLAGSVVLILTNPSRITQENFDRIQYGMTDEDVTNILGEGITDHATPLLLDLFTTVINWENGPSWIRVRFDVTDRPRSLKACSKSLHIATPWETLQWYAKKGAAKMGIKWD
jgi:hypothetical protein